MTEQHLEKLRDIFDMAQDALVWLEKILKDEQELYDNFPEELLFDDGEDQEDQIGDNITELQELIDDLDDWMIRLSELHDANDDLN